MQYDDDDDKRILSMLMYKRCLHPRLSLNITPKVTTIPISILAIVVNMDNLGIMVYHENHAAEVVDCIEE